MYDEDQPNRPEDDEALTPAERELAGALRGLSPAAPLGIDRDRMLFEAGRAAASRPLFRWRVTAAAAAALAAAVGVMFAARLERSPEVVREVVYVDRPTAMVSPSLVTAAAVAAPVDDVRFIASPGFAEDARRAFQGSADGSDYLALRDRALRWGVAAAFGSGSKPSAGRAAVVRPQPLDINQLLDDATDTPRSSTGDGRRHLQPKTTIRGEQL